jgi:hypothetical protein
MCQVDGCKLARSITHGLNKGGEMAKSGDVDSAFGKLPYLEPQFPFAVACAMHLPNFTCQVLFFFLSLFSSSSVSYLPLL